MLDQMLADGTFADENDHLLLLRSLESRTRQTLEHVVSSRSLTVDVTDAHREAKDYAQALAANPDWDGFMRETLEIGTAALPEFEKLRELGAAEHAQALQETVEHERAVIDYSSARLAGRRAAAALAVSAHLESCGERRQPTG